MTMAVELALKSIGMTGWSPIDPLPFCFGLGSRKARPDLRGSRKPPNNNLCDQVMIFESDFDSSVFECIVNNAKGRSKHCARNAVHHLERALIIKEIDPEMAVFRAITAEEEAATAIFLVLIEQGYQHAERIRFTEHKYKQALEPFVRAISKFVSKWSSEPSFPFGSEYSLFMKGQGRDRKLSLSFIFQGQTITCIPPLGFSIMLNDQMYFFEQELLEIVSGDSRHDVLKYVKKMAKRRNQVLYAQTDGIPNVIAINGFLEKRREVVISFLRIYALIYPYTEKAIFVQQALNCFLSVMGQIELAEIA